jgi:hypothetical protein
MEQRIRVEFPALERSCHFLPPIKRGYHDLLGNLKIYTKADDLFNSREVAWNFFEISKYSSSKKKVDRIPIFPTMHFLVLGSTGLYTLYHSYLADQLTVLSFKVRSGISFVILLSRQGILSPFLSEIGTRYQPESPTTKGWQSSKEYWKTKIL